MQKYSFEDIYYTLCGDICEECAVPGVENVYAEGSDCDVLYCEMSLAYERSVSSGRYRRIRRLHRGCMPQYSLPSM